MNAIDFLVVFLVGSAVASIYLWRGRAGRGRSPARSILSRSAHGRSPSEAAPDGVQVKVPEQPSSEKDVAISGSSSVAGDMPPTELPESSAADLPQDIEVSLATEGGPPAPDTQPQQEPSHHLDRSQSAEIENPNSSTAEASRGKDAYSASDSPVLNDSPLRAEVAAEAPSPRGSTSEDKSTSLASNGGPTDDQCESGGRTGHRAGVEKVQGDELAEVPHMENLGKPSPIAETESRRRQPRKSPLKYRGLVRTAPKQKEAGRSGSPDESSPRDRSLPIEVRLMVQRGGFCTVSLIAKRISNLPENLTVTTPDGSLGLRALQEEWYQDIIPPDISRVLGEGIEWGQEGDGNRCRWLLSGREIYVLAARPDLRGYVSQPCLGLGREHVVLCTERLRDPVEEAIRTAGATPSEVMDSSVGAPPGWVALRGIIPKAAVLPTDGPDIFNAVRPLPRIEISIEGGIRLEYAIWLEGFPPSIRVYGDADHSGEVLIDGHRASCGEDDAYRVNGWDSVGSHTVWCGGSSKSYSITQFTASWELWDAYTFPVSYGADRRLAVCGPLVREWPDEGGANRSLLVPETHPIVIGSVPGQCFAAARCARVRGIPLVASPPFDPVWALPPDPLHCDKRNTAIMSIGKPIPPELVRQRVQQVSCARRASVTSWCRLILDASRKGLHTRPDTETIRELWNDYELLARRIWRAQK